MAVPADSGSSLMKELMDLSWPPDKLLRAYQIRGVEWLKACHQSGHGALLCDEMGLGKTCQAIALTLLTKSMDKVTLIVCPLSVIDNWRQEVARFSPKLNILTYIGDQQQRSVHRRSVKRSPPDILLTTYDLCLRDIEFLEHLKYNLIIVDEGHRLKNSESLLYQAMLGLTAENRFLLTGTPIQNNMGEMFSLLCFVTPNKFKLNNKDRFVEKYMDVKNSRSVAAELQELIKPYILARTKAQVALEIPEKTEVVLYHPLTDLQKKYYKALLTKDLNLFNTEETGARTALNNLLVHLRKCVDHPYLFDGVEPEPFSLGEHLIEASGKLVILDKLLHHLYLNGHKVLIFSTMTRMLDILQDYLHFRGYAYERLDGSVRGEERFTAVRDFNQSNDTFAFLLSTRAGGQGLNLTAADTVIFCDSDFNPQVDEQAAARAHRIGQTRPVKIIKLVGKSTVEEVIYNRAREKLKLSNAVMTATKSDSNDDGAPVTTPHDLRSMLISGVHALFNTTGDEVDSVKDENIVEIVGPSADGRWCDSSGRLKTEEGTKGKQDTEEQMENIYEYEGRDYTDIVHGKVDDEKVIDEWKSEREAELLDDDGVRPRRSKDPEAGPSLVYLPDARKKKPLTEQQLIARRVLREKAAEQRAKEAEERLRKKDERKLAKWKEVGYVSKSIPLYSGDEDEDLASDDEIDYLHFVRGDATQPQTNDSVIIIHCVDASGEWGQGGLFTALNNVSKEAGEYYELAGTMKDLKEGDCHLIEYSEVDGYDRYQVALFVAMNSKLKLVSSNLKTCLIKLAQYVHSKDNISVHMPRIGFNTPGFDWYGTERLIRKHLAEAKIHTYIYYFRRKRPNQRASSPSSSHQNTANSAPSADMSISSCDETPSASHSKRPRLSCTSDGPLINIFSGKSFFFDTSLTTIERKELTRLVIAYDGDITSVTDSNTYTVCIEPCTKEGYVVKPEFVVDSIKHGQMLPAKTYCLD